MIGSRVSYGDDAGTLLETISVAVAFYRNYQCAATMEGLHTWAAYPERIQVAVDAPCLQPPEGPYEERPDQATCRYRAQIEDRLPHGGH